MPRVEEDETERRIGCDASPSSAALGPWEHQAWQHAVWGVRAHVDRLVEHFGAVFLRLWRDLADLLAGHPIARQPGWLHRKRLRGPGRVTGRVEHRHRAVLDAEQRLAGESMKHE